jgi:acetyl esterase
MTLSQPSVRSEGHGWGLAADDLRWFVQQWVPDPARRTDPTVSPLHAEVSGLRSVLGLWHVSPAAADVGETLFDRFAAVLRRQSRTRRPRPPR